MKLGHAVALLGLVTNVTPAAAAPRQPATSCDAWLKLELAATPGKSELAAAARKVASAAHKLAFMPEVHLAGADAAAIGTLGRDPALAAVAVLEIPCLSAAGSSVFQPDVFPGLTMLKLGRECHPDVAAVKALLALPRRAPLTVTLPHTAALSKSSLEALARLAPESPVSFSIAVRCPELARLDRTGFLRHVSRVIAYCGDDGAKLLARSTNTTALRGLEINACAGDEAEVGHHMTSATAKLVAGAPGLAGVVDLGFANDSEFCQEPGIGPAGLEAILAAPFAPRLRSLTLTQQSLRPKGVAALVSSTRLPALRRLIVQGARFSAANVRQLVQSGPLAPVLEELALAGVELDEGWDLDDTTAPVLVDSMRMPALRRLDVSENRFAKETVERVKRARWARGLEILDVSEFGQSLECLPAWYWPEVTRDP